MDAVDGGETSGIARRGKLPLLGLRKEMSDGESREEELEGETAVEPDVDRTGDREKSKDREGLGEDEI